MGLDTRTLIVVASLASFMYASVLALEARREADSRWLGIWAVAILSSGFANAAYAFHGLLPIHVTSQLGFLFSSAGFALMLGALRAFDRAKSEWTTFAVIGLALTVAHGLVLSLHAPERGLIIFTSFAYAGWLVMCARQAFTRPADEHLSARTAVAIAFAVWTGAFLVRGILACALTDAEVTLLRADVLQTTFLLVQFAALFGGSLAFVMMSKQRSDAYVLHLASTDDLTGLTNRRRFLELAPLACANAARDASPLCVFVADLDHFKHVNDTYGHRAGDVALRAFARALLANLRAGDIASRVGGEEFAVVLPRTDLAAACAIAERMRAAVADARIDFEGRELLLRVSVGVAEWVPGVETVERLLARADQALYAAKRAGRDQVVAAPRIAVAS